MKEKKYKSACLLVCFCYLNVFSCFSQDTVNIREVNVVTYVIKQNLLTIPAAASVIDSTQIETQKFNSLVPVLNTVPGVRMEERSPGSYRLSIRGSLLRSPFGVRNIKVYFDGLPLTDAGGNTYINVIPAEALNSIEILKGPDGSVFGANSGGVVTLMPPKRKDLLSVEISGGSYGLLRRNIMYAKRSNKNDFSIIGNFYNNHGYRDNSSMKRFYMQANDNWQYAEKGKLNFLFFYSDLYYQTPGGLTYNQFSENPEHARPASTTLPGAASQKAAVYNKVFFGGITHTWQLSKAIKNVFSVFGSQVDFKNPFITNYETRAENTFGGRSYFVVESVNKLRPAQWEYNVGAEWQQTKAQINNYTNTAGTKGDLLAQGKVNTKQYFVFNRIKLALFKKFTAEAGLSLNYYSYHFADSFDLRSSFEPQWMPRVALSYAFGNLVFRTSLSKGYSPPSTAEIRPSDNRINANLNAEQGTNIEVGFRYLSSTKKWWIDISGYNYQLADAIVQQKNDNGNEFFINAGRTRQQGVEVQCSYMFISPQQNKSVTKLQVSTSNTLAHYRFKDYNTATGDYTGNAITGVPGFVIVNSLSLELKNSFFLFAQHNHTSSLPLNDANNAYATAFDILQMKMGYGWDVSLKLRMKFITGVDNLFNTRYSLGNDLNAAGGRFYNAAPLRNFFAGVAFSIK